MTTSTAQLILYSLLAALPVVYIVRRLFVPTVPNSLPTPAKKSDEPKTLMQPPREDLQPPKDDPFTQERLKEFDGSDESKPIYVALKGESTIQKVVTIVTSVIAHRGIGTVFDVSRKADVYGKGKSYNLFAGKDGSKGLGMSSLKPEHAIPDYSELDVKDMKVLDDWHGFFL
jgi:membrane-associated progesterone receptor component